MAVNIGVPDSFGDVLTLALVIIFTLSSLAAAITTAVIRRNGFLYLGVQMTALFFSLYLARGWIRDLWFASIFDDPDSLARAALSGALFSAAFAIDMALRYFVWYGVLAHAGRPLVPKLLIGVVRLLTYLTTSLAVLQFVHGQSITALATLSGAFALIIGLSAQTTLGEMFAGIAIALSKPFRIGDWVRIGPLDEGRVTDITWRLVRIETRDRMVMHVTNRVVADSPIRNYSFPTHVVRLTDPIRLPQDADPEAAQALLQGAIAAADGVLADPAPHALFRGCHDGFADFVLQYFIDDYARRDQIVEAVWKSVQAHSRDAGLAVALPTSRMEIVAEPAMLAARA